jgi:glycosyltransferase involved in cell wall biosynthesis
MIFYADAGRSMYSAVRIAAQLQCSDVVRAMATITAVIPVFNSAATICCAIESVLKQNLPGIGKPRIIVVDDGSTDALSVSLLDYQRHITLIRHPNNRGAAAARNTGIAAVESGYVAFLDADDVWLANKVCRQIEVMICNKWLASCTAYYYSRGDGVEIVSPKYRTREITQEDSLWGCFLGPGSTLVCDRKVFDVVGLLDARLRRLEDWEWQLRLVQHFKLGFVGQPLSRVRKSHNSDLDSVNAALEIIRAAHHSNLPRSLQRRFDSAMDFERAGAKFRVGKIVSASKDALKGLIRVPFRNGSLSAILHNRRLG